MLRLALCLLLLPVLLYAQPDTLWTRTLDNSHCFQAYSLAPTADGGCLLVGEGLVDNFSTTDINLIKLTAGGAMEWERLIDLGQFEYGRGFLPTADGGYVISGDRWTDWEGVATYFLVKINANGDTLWTRTYGPDSSGREWEIKSMAAVPGGGYALVGTTAPDMWNYHHLMLARFSANGDSLWTRYYFHSPYGEGATRVIGLDDGFLILGGVNEGNWLVRTDLNGDTLWTRIIHPEGMSCSATALCATPDGGFLIGSTYQDSEYIGYGWLVKVNGDGDTVWTRPVPGTAQVYLYDVQPTRDGGFIAAGVESEHWLMVKVDSAGNLLWRQSGDPVQDPGNELTELYGVCQTADGGYAAAGKHYPHAFAVRTAPEIPSSANAPQGSPALFALQPCYPNPFNAATRISFDLPVASTVTLDIVDLTGRQVATLAEGYHGAGEHTLLFDGHNLASGMYFYRLRAGSFYQTRKMMLLR